MANPDTSAAATAAPLPDAAPAQTAGQNLLAQIVEQLPIALTVQDHDGRFILANAAAATSLDIPLDALIGASPADFLPPAEAAARRQWESNLIRSGKASTIEEKVAGPHGAQTWLTWHQPVRLADQTLLMTSSLDITARKEIEDALLQRVNFDDLTGLPNRILIREHVDRILHDPHRRFALAFIDLDNFKHINDYYSHAVGDALLLKIARRIAKRLRDSDMVARISGDEFLLLLDPITDDDQIKAIVAQILWDLKQPFHIEAFEVFTSASIGVSIHPEHGLTYEELRRNADSAMYRAKGEAKGDAVYFDLHMGQAITARMELEQRLRLAIRDRRFCCAFQPKVDIRSQAVVGFETLVRWRDDEGEIHPPSSFIDLAIELGLIDTITRFVLAETLRSIELLDREFGPTTTFSVNVAAKQASDLNFMLSFVEILRASAFAPRIMIELTEDAFAAKSRFQMQILPRLRELGVRVSIDDFGTGYSSLSALADITADELKVDRSFISAIHERPRSQSVLRAIESLGHALGMSIVAEGVETFEELAYLQAATRIPCAQGYYFSKPFFLAEAAGAKRTNLDGRTLEVARASSGGRGVHAGRVAVASRMRRD
jgi:diguanylate cyclase (GGDEF)-like protein/PAS domain S-box-containing protein